MRDRSSPNDSGCDNELCRSVEANLSLHENDSNDLLSGRTVEIVLPSRSNNHMNNTLDEMHRAFPNHQSRRRRRRTRMAATMNSASSNCDSETSTSSSSFFREAVRRTADNPLHSDANHHLSSSYNFNDGMRSICSWIGMEPDNGGGDHNDDNNDDFSELLSMDRSLLTSSAAGTGAAATAAERTEEHYSYTLPPSTNTTTAIATASATAASPLQSTAAATAVAVLTSSSPVASIRSSQSNHQHNAVSSNGDLPPLHNNEMLSQTRHDDNNKMDDDDDDDDDDNSTINMASTTTGGATIAERTEEYLQNAATGIVRERPEGDPEYAHTVLEEADVLLGYTCHTKPLQIWREIRGSRRWISETECHLLIVKYRETLAERYPSLQTPRQPLFLKKATAAEASKHDNSSDTYTWSRQLKNGEMTHWRKATFRDIQKDVKSKRHPRKDLSTAIAEFRQELAILKQLGVEMDICNNVNSILNGFQVIEEMAHVGAETNMTSKFCEVMRCLLDKVKKMKLSQGSNGEDYNASTKNTLEDDEEEDLIDDADEHQSLSGKRRPSSKKRATKRGSRSSSNTCPRPSKQSKTGTKKKKTAAIVAKEKKEKSNIDHSAQNVNGDSDVELISTRKKAPTRKAASTRKKKFVSEETPASEVSKAIEEFYNSPPTPCAQEISLLRPKGHSTPQASMNHQQQHSLRDGLSHNMSMLQFHSNVKDHQVPTPNHRRRDQQTLSHQQGVQQQNWIRTNDIVMQKSIGNRQLEFHLPFAISMPHSAASVPHARMPHATTEKNADDESLSSDNESIHQHPHLFSNAFDPKNTRQHKEQEYTNIVESYIGSTILPQNDSNMSVSSCSDDDSLFLRGKNTRNTAAAAATTATTTTTEFPSELAIAYCGLSRIEKPARTDRLASDTPELESVGKQRKSDSGYDIR